MSAVYNNRSIIKGTLILLPLLGLTWLFGLLTVNENTTVFAWIFTILNSFQVHMHVCIMPPIISVPISAPIELSFRDIFM